MTKAHPLTTGIFAELNAPPPPASPLTAAEILSQVVQAADRRMAILLSQMPTVPPSGSIETDSGSGLPQMDVPKVQAAQRAAPPAPLTSRSSASATAKSAIGSAPAAPKKPAWLQLAALLKEEK